MTSYFWGPKPILDAKELCYRNHGHSLGGGQGKRERGDEGAGGVDEGREGRRKGGRREKRGREEGEGRKKRREGKRGLFCAHEARAASEGRGREGEVSGREGEVRGREGGEAYPPVHPLIAS